MARINVVCANLHTPVLVAGTNLGMTIEKAKRTGLKMIYDQEIQHLEIYYKDKVKFIPMANVAGYDPEILETIPDAKPEPEGPKPLGKVKAQVSGPTDHVFAGPGAGMTNRK